MQHRLNAVISSKLFLFTFLIVLTLSSLLKSFVLFIFDISFSISNSTNFKSFCHVCSFHFQFYIVFIVTWNFSFFFFLVILNLIFQQCNSFLVLLSSRRNYWKKEQEKKYLPPTFTSSNVFALFGGVAVGESEVLLEEKEEASWERWYICYFSEVWPSTLTTTSARFTRRNFYQIRVAVISSRYPVIIIGVPLILDSTKEFTVVSLVSRRNRLIWPTSNDSSGIIKKWRRFQKIVVASAAPFQGEYLRLTPSSEFWSPHCSGFSNAFHDWITVHYIETFICHSIFTSSFLAECLPI